MVVKGDNSMVLNNEITAKELRKIMIEQSKKKQSQFDDTLPVLQFDGRRVQLAPGCYRVLPCVTYG